MLSSGPGLPHVQSVRESRFQNPGNLCLLDPESWTFESGILLKESRIPLMIEIQNPSSTDKNWNPANETWNPYHGIQNPRLSWIPFIHGKHGSSTYLQKIIFSILWRKMNLWYMYLFVNSTSLDDKTLFNRLNAHKKGCRSCTSNSFPGHSKCTAPHFSGDLKLNSSQRGLQPLPMEGDSIFF